MLRYLIIGQLAACMVFVGCQKQPETRSEEGFPFITLAKGSWSGVHEPSDLVLKEESEFRDIWGKLTFQTAEPAPFPVLDFAKDMVIAVFAGQKPTAGYSIEIVRVQDAGDHIDVQVMDTKPPPDALTAQVFTFPYHIVKVAKSDKPVKFLHSEAVAELGKAEQEK